MERSQIEAIVLRQLTPRHMPDRLLFIERVPRTPSGKASHRDLLALAVNADAEANVKEAATC